MPYIIVQAGAETERENAEMLRERITPSDLESPHFCSQLVERLQWAMGDALNHERASIPTSEETLVEDQPAASVVTTAS